MCKSNFSVSNLSAIFSKENATPPYFFKTCERVTKKKLPVSFIKGLGDRN